MMEKDEGWLKNELHKRGYESYKDIFFAEWNELIDDERGKAGELYVVERTEKRHPEEFFLSGRGDHAMSVPCTDEASPRYRRDGSGKCVAEM